MPPRVLDWLAADLGKLEPYFGLVTFVEGPGCVVVAENGKDFLFHGFRGPEQYEVSDVLFEC